MGFFCCVFFFLVVIMAPTTNNVKIIFGGAVFSTQYGFDADKVSEVLSWLEKEGIKTIDSSEIYGDSEELLGAANAAGKGFTIDTKIGGGLARVESTSDRVVKAAEESLRKLNTDSVGASFMLLCSDMDDSGTNG